MLEINRIRQNPEEVIESLKIKNMDARETLEKVISLDTRRREAQKKLDETLAESNALAKEIGMLFKSGKHEEGNALKTKTAELKNLSKDLSAEKDNTEVELEKLLVQLPNLPHESVPAGNSDADNVVIRTEGEAFEKEGMLPHWELAQKYDIIDFELGSKITGAGFPVYKGKGAALQRALVHFFISRASAEGYVEIQPPLVVNEASGYGTGQLPDKDGQMYHIGEDNLYLIPTAEVPITNLYRDVILKEKDLPLKNVAYSACFRREAGSYGKDVRGLNRLHQFDKVEIVQIDHPERSYETLDTMCAHVTSLLQELKLPFRVLRLCGGDLSFTSALTFDLEVWSAAQKKWLEVSSVSNFETYQSNRMKLRFKDENGKTRLAHTLNGSALALPRIVAALLENYQDAEGIRIPDVLVPFTGFERID